MLELYNDNSTFKYEAAFYMALSYLKEKNENKTREWLNKIPVDAAVHQKVKSLEKNYSIVYCGLAFSGMQSIAQDVRA